MIRPTDVLRARLALGLTQTQFAALVDAKGGHRTIRRWEGGRTPAPAFHERLERVLKLSEKTNAD